MIILLNGFIQEVFDRRATTRPLDGVKISEVNSTPSYGPVPGPPPPPRNDSLNNVTKKPVQVSLSSGPSVPSEAPVLRHSSLDASQKQSIASALTNVLERTRIKELPTSPKNPLSPSSPMSSTAFSPHNISPSALPSTNLSHVRNLMSPEGVGFLTRSPANMVSIAVESDRRRRPPPLIKQGSLYISPRKLSVAGFSPLDDVGYPHKRKAGQILKAGGVDSGDFSGSRSNLLEAIRKGIQLRKV